MGIERLIQTAMTAKQMRNETLAELTGVSTATAARWANGAMTPHPRRWPSIEEALDLAPGKIAAEFYGDVSPADPELAAVVADLQADHQDLAELVRSLTARLVAVEQQADRCRRAG